VGGTYAYWLRWSLAIPMVVLEGVKPGMALARSRVSPTYVTLLWS